MQHLLPFYLFLCLVCGVAGGLVLAMVRRRSGYRPLTWLLAFTAAMGLNLLYNLFAVYESINIDSSISPLMFGLMAALVPVGALQFLAGPLFMHGLFRLPWRRRGDIAAVAVMALTVGVALSPLSVRYSAETRHLALGPGYAATQAVYLAYIVYTLVLALACRKRLADQTERRRLDAFLILTAVFLPGFTHDLLFFAGSPGLDSLPAAVIFYPLYYCVLCGAAFWHGTVWLVRHWLAAEFPERSLPDPAALRAAFLVRGLSEREADLVPLVAEGLGNKQIADRLGISVKTVNNHLYNLYQKLGINSRYELLVLAGAAPAVGEAGGADAGVGRDR
jgi:DNA-binding CsgD family transcriptional regulator